MGMVFYETEQYSDAISAFRKVAHLSPDNFEAWYNLGHSYLVWHEYTDAIAAYTKSAELKPDDYMVLGYLASARFSAGLYAEAAEASAKALAQKPDEPWIISINGFNICCCLSMNCSPLGFRSF